MAARTVGGALFGGGLLVGVIFFPSDAKNTDDAGPNTLPAFEQDPVLRTLDTSQPLFPGLESMTLNDARDSQAPIYVPSHLPDEADGTDPEFWSDDRTNEFGLRYGSTVVILMTSWSKDADPADEYAQQASDWKAGEATTIDGHPAWIIPPDGRAPGEPPVSVVHVTRGQFDVTLYSPVSIEELVRVAKSLEPHAALFVPGSLND